MVAKMKTAATNFLRDEEGATLVEYVLLVALIGVAAVVAITFLSNKAQNTLNKAGNAMP